MDTFHLLGLMVLRTVINGYSIHLSLVWEKHDYKIVNILSDVTAQDWSLVLLPGVHFLSLAGQMEELSNKNCSTRWRKSVSSLCDFF